MKCSSNYARRWSPLIAVGAAALTLGGWLQKPQDPTPTDTLTPRIERIEAYLQAQAKSAQALEDALDEAVDQGYTAGINYRSRETLIDAWKKQNTAALMDVPGSKTSKKQTLEK